MLILRLTMSRLAHSSSYLLFYHSNACECDHHSEISEFVDAKKLLKKAKEDARREAGLENGQANEDENNRSSNNHNSNNHSSHAMDEAMSSSAGAQERRARKSSLRRYGPMRSDGDSMHDQYRNPYESPYKRSLSDDAPPLSSVSRTLAFDCEDAIDRETSMEDDEHVRRRDAEMAQRRQLASEERRSHLRGVRANTSQRRLPASQARRERMQERYEKRPRSPREMGENGWPRADEALEYQMEKSMRHERNLLMNSTMFAEERCVDSID